MTTRSPVLSAVMSLGALSALTLPTAACSSTQSKAADDPSNKETLIKIAMAKMAHTTDETIPWEIRCPFPADRLSVQVSRDGFVDVLYRGDGGEFWQVQTPDGGRTYNLTPFRK